MKYIYCLLCLLTISTSALAQRVCDTDIYTRRHWSPAAKPPVEDNFGRDTMSNEVIIIPVVVHVLFHNAAQNISDAQILSQIEVLNKDFRLLNTDRQNIPSPFKPFSADTRIQFCLARVDPQGRETRGIIRRYTNNEYFLADDGMKFKSRGGDDAWDSRKYLNLWVCSMLGRTLGYATLPGGDPVKDGVVINYDVFGANGGQRSPFNLGRTATHEVGHWMGLMHLWGDEDCGSDGVDDTPRQRGYNYGCPSFPHTTACSENITGDMFMNFMDFTNDACMHMFTAGQKTKMRSVFSATGWRNNFLNSYVCDSTYAAGGPLPNDTLPVAKPADNVEVYPNPVIDIFKLRSKDLATMSGKMLEIYSIEGRRLKMKLLSSNTETMDIRELPAGIYIIRIQGLSPLRIIKK